MYADVTVWQHSTTVEQGTPPSFLLLHFFPPYKINLRVILPNALLLLVAFLPTLPPLNPPPHPLGFLQRSVLSSKVFIKMSFENCQSEELYSVAVLLKLGLYTLVGKFE
ncbi:hypothetical protein ILYODFUR_011718 [Ilyodon furcidens]|uniref:Uncharacterized protein n=1 Tax=Ilyodon furcidens TaxID=33524 RepID=A0ABV0SNE5_9TELE